MHVNCESFSPAKLRSGNRLPYELLKEDPFLGISYLGAGKRVGEQGV